MNDFMSTKKRASLLRGAYLMGLSLQISGTPERESNSQPPDP